jgi:hypothetical protein
MPYDHLTCTHQIAAGKTGLCPGCQEEYETDPSAWYEYGHHPRGEENWRKTQEEIAEFAAMMPTTPIEPDPEMPF